MKNTTGQGDPEKGDAFGEAQSTFNAVNETLKSAVPDDGWDGSGSYAYADQNTRQQLRSEAMADADHEVHKVLYREAAQITLRRGYLDDQYNFLANTSYVTFPLQFIPRYGEAMKLAIEIGALQTALGESYHQYDRLQSEVAQNAAELQQAVGRYSGVADGAELPGAAVHFDPPPPPPGGGIAGPSGVSGGIDPPPLPQVPPLGSLLSPVAGFVTGAAPAAGQLTAAPAQRRAKKGRPRDEESTDHEDKADDKDPTKAASGDGEPSARPCTPGAIPIPNGCTRPSRLGWMRTIHPGRRPGRHRRIGHRRIEGREEGTMSGDDLRVTTTPPRRAGRQAGPRGSRDQICHNTRRRARRRR